MSEKEYKIKCENLFKKNTILINQQAIDAEQIRALQKQSGELTDRLTKAEEIIKELLNSCFGYNSKIVNYEVKAKAEQFLKENA